MHGHAHNTQHTCIQHTHTCIRTCAPSFSSSARSVARWLRVSRCASTCVCIYVCMYVCACVGSFSLSLACIHMHGHTHSKHTHTANTHTHMRTCASRSSSVGPTSETALPDLPACTHSKYVCVYVCVSVCVCVENVSACKMHTHAFIRCDAVFVARNAYMCGHEEQCTKHTHTYTRKRCDESM
jgi:hypothetical protein